MAKVLTPSKPSYRQPPPRIAPDTIGRDVRGDSGARRARGFRRGSGLPGGGEIRADTAVRGGIGIRSDSGIALLMALVLTSLVGALAAVLIFQATMDVTLAAAYRTGHEVFYAADAAIERTRGELATSPDWTTILAGPPASPTAPFSDGGTSIRAPGGRTYDAAALLAARQAATPATYGADTPVWHLYAHVGLERLWPRPLAGPPVMLVVFVADEGEDGDGDPARDTNGQVLVHVDAYGLYGAHRAIEARMARVDAGVVHLAGWTDVSR